MSYKSKRTITSMAASIFLLVGYYVIIMSKIINHTPNLQSWAVSSLVFIGISIVVQIVIQILFQITYAIGIARKEREQDNKKLERMIHSSAYEDEMDKLINLKSMRIYSFCVVTGFLAALFMLAFGIPAGTTLFTLFGFFVSGTLVEGAVRVCLYERGVSNG